MKVIIYLPFLILFSLSGYGLKSQSGNYNSQTPLDTGFVWKTEQFADVNIIRYLVPGWDKLSMKQKTLVYYLTKAGLCGRDIIYDQNFKYNIPIRKAIENILKNYEGDKTDIEWKNFIVYAKRFFVANGIHHHEANDKLKPDFSKTYFETLLKGTGSNLPEEAKEAIFNNLYLKKVNLDPDKGLLESSAINFYDEGISTAEAEDWFEKKINPNDEKPISYGLNSKLIRGKNGLEEQTWKSDGLYAPAINSITMWLKEAVDVAENEPQRKALMLLIEYYQTGDLHKWDEYNIAWSQATEGDIDYINGFIETDKDPLGYKAAFESIVQINDFEASERMKVLADNAQWFEDHAPLLPAHKKKKVTGVSYKVVNVAGESGDASPMSPIGVNLPNSNWIRQDYGSKSVSLGNIEDAYLKSVGSGILTEFANDQDEIKLANDYGDLSGKIHTALHEVLGHASGQLNPGVSEPAKTLKQYASTLEEARADLFGLYYILDPKLVTLVVMPSVEAGKAQYDAYIRNGMLEQLRIIEPGKDIEESHMRCRQLVSHWVFEKGKKDKIIEKIERNGKTYFNINDYKKLRTLFGELLKEIQRIKSEGDYKSGAALVENYGVKVDKALHNEVLKRSESLNIPPYGAFINPNIILVTNRQGVIEDVKIEYPDDFLSQMLDYGNRYSFLK